MNKNKNIIIILSCMLFVFLVCFLFTFNYSFSFPLNTPKIISFNKDGSENNSLKLTFKSNNTGTDYSLEIINKQLNKTYNISGSNTYYVFQNLVGNKDYEVIMRACSNKNRQYICSNWTNSVKNNIGNSSALKKLIINSLSTNSNNDAIFKYNASNNANGVEIFNSTTKKSYYTTNKNTYTIAKLNSGKSYSFKIREYVIVNNKKIFGPFSDSKSLKIKNTTYTVIFNANGGSGSMRKQTIVRGKKTKLSANKFKRKGYQFVGWATYNKRKITDMKHFQIGKVVYKNSKEVNNLAKAGGSIKLYAVWKGSGPQAACDWSVKIANDNSFAYGTGSRAHHYGCYYCGTNISGKKHAARGSKWEKTYCCNPFVHAAYSHGANHKKMLKYCEKGSGGGMSNASWTRFNSSDGKFKAMGKLSLKKLKKGDILWNSHHVRLYIGNHKVAEAASEGWGSDTIHVKKISSNNYHVLRPYGFK